MKRKVTTPQWVHGRTIYEVNIRQYTAEGTFNAFAEHLPRLKELGVGIIWFMPIYPIGKKKRKGSLGSYYSIADYSDINPEFGTLDDFIALVNRIHGLGMKVIIDWVANHTAWDHIWTHHHPEFYTKDESGGFKAPVEDWEDVIHLDYGNHDLWDEMIGEMAFWVKETGIDGFRCDMAHLVPTLFWNRARRELDKIKPVYMLAESENHDLLEYAFDTLYNWKLLHVMDDLAGGRTDAASLMELILNEQAYLPAGASLLNFTSNHDENSWQGSAIERIHYYLEPLTVLTFLLPGLPLIYSGQEAGNYRRLIFFDKDAIEWKEDKMTALFRQLAALKSEWTGRESDLNVIPIKNDAEEHILSLDLADGNKRVVVMLNLSAEKQTFYIQCNHYDGDWNDVFQNQRTLLDCKQPINLDPYGYRVLVKAG